MKKRVLTASLIAHECDEIKALLIVKNKNYGDSAFKPLGIFARYPAEILLRARIDDKLARIARGRERDVSEDTIMDLIGYLILLRAYKRALRKGWLRG